MGGILTALGLNGGTFIFQIIDFLLLFLFLRIFVWPPLVKAMAQRRKRIEDQLAAAEADRQQAERMRQEREAALAAARAEAQSIVDRAERIAAEEAKTLLDDARSQAERIRLAVVEETAREKEAALRALRQDVADLALLAASKVLGRRVDAAEDRRLAEEFVVEVGRGDG